MPTDHMLVAPDFRPLLERSRLDSFDEIMTVAGEETVRAFPGRNTVRLSLAREDGGARTMGHTGSIVTHIEGTSLTDTVAQA